MQASDYIGKKWSKGGRGPDTFDCWGLVTHYYSEVLGITIPNFLVDPDNLKAVSGKMESEASSSKWEEVEDFTKNSIVVMGTRGVFTHVGVVVSERHRLIMHCSRPAGSVVVEDIRTLRRGYSKIKYYIPK